MRLYREITAAASELGRGGRSFVDASMTTLTLDPHMTLGVSSEADESAIRRAFRRLAQELHPDHNDDPGAAEAFLRVRAAYEMLTDPSRSEEAEAEAIMAAAERAAAEAMQQRPGPVSTAPPVCVALESRRGRLPGLPAAAALRVALGLGVSGAGLLALTGIAGMSMGALGLLCLSLALWAWLTRRVVVELRLYADHFVDARWEVGCIRWGDVLTLDPDHASGVLDLQLNPALVEHLGSTEGFPSSVLVWQGGRSFYRLPLGAWLPDVLTLIEARTGLRAR